LAGVNRGWTPMNADKQGPQGILADLDDTSPATYWYYFHDNLGSTRRLRAQNKNSLGVYEYTPYGEIYHESGPAITYKYTGHAWDPLAQLYYAPYRYYSPSNARWITRDPLGMDDGPNVYAYVTGDPVNRTDQHGEFAIGIVIAVVLLLALASLSWCAYVLKENNDAACAELRRKQDPNRAMLTQKAAELSVEDRQRTAEKVQELAGGAIEACIEATVNAITGG